MSSVMSEVLAFLDTMGLFDVVLPFLLIYTMVYALLDKTKVFGEEKYILDKKEITVAKKNLNAIFAFAVAFFAILSAQIVDTIHKAIGPIMILILCIVLFLMTISIFNPNAGMHNFTNSSWMKFFIPVVLITIVLIFLGSIPTKSGVSWLEYLWAIMSNKVNTGVVGAVILLLIMAGIMMYVGAAPKPSGSSGGKE